MSMHYRRAGLALAYWPSVFKAEANICSHDATTEGVLTDPQRISWIDIGTHSTRKSMAGQAAKISILYGSLPARPTREIVPRHLDAPRPAAAHQLHRVSSSSEKCTNKEMRLGLPDVFIGEIHENNISPPSSTVDLTVV